jgi:phosphomannomutase
MTPPPTDPAMASPFRHDFDPTVLREYDIRGIVDKTLHPADAFAIGRCFGTVVARAGGHVVAVGYDGRLSSPRLEPSLVDGLKASGMEVVRVGLGPTPMLYYASATLKTDGAVMLTGSHNPPDYNGFKMVLQGKPFFGSAIRDLGAMAAAGDVVEAAEGSTRDIDIAADYVARLITDWDGGDRLLNVVWDNGNGAAGAVLQRLVGSLPGRHTVLFGDIDGRFPNHHPDPTVPKNLEALIAAVKDQKADLGIAFDGDADRIGVVDDSGEMMFGDQLLVVLARDVLKSLPGSTIIADVKASQVLFDEVAKAGGKPLMWRTGHSLIKAKMAETGSPLAGEMSGHTFYADKWYGFDDALYAAVRLLGIVARMEGKLSDVRLALPQVVNTPELRFNCDDMRKFAVIEEVAGRLRAAGAQLSDIDGVRVQTEDGWWLLRASNTQAVLVARAEASGEAGLERLKAALVAQLAASGLEAPDFSGANAGH